jgi:CheY-like chemotaxis protein
MGEKQEWNAITGSHFLLPSGSAGRYFFKAYPTRMSNIILIVDDDHEHEDNLAYFFRLFDDDRGAKFDILGGGQPRRPRLVPYRQDCPFKFLEFFEAAHLSGRRYPLCIVDMIMPDESGLLDELRGVTVSRRVREIDPEIHIVIATIKPDLDGEAICREVGGSTHFFQTPFSPEQEEAFVLKVHELMDEWNGRH